MTTLLLLLALAGTGPLRTSGLAANPPELARPAPAPAPAPRPDPPKPPVPTHTCQCVPPCGCPNCSCSAPAVKRQLWELRAVDGTVYRMYERAELIQLVTEHNRRTARATAPPPMSALPPPLYFGGSSCASGQCGR